MRFKAEGEMVMAMKELEEGMIQEGKSNQEEEKEGKTGIFLAFDRCSSIPIGGII